MTEQTANYSQLTATTVISAEELETIFAYIPHQNYNYDTFVPNLSAFCQRICYSGPLTPTFPVLQALHFHFILTFPFENLSIHGLPHILPSSDTCTAMNTSSSTNAVPLPVSVDPAIIEEKLLKQGRGGYCFEMNQYFACVLRAIGFKVATKSARVLWQFVPGFARARTHLVSLVHLQSGDESNSHIYLCDVSFGGNSPPMPISLSVGGIAQDCIYDSYRIVDMPTPLYPKHHKSLQIRRNDPLSSNNSNSVNTATDSSASTEAPVPTSASQEEWIDMYFLDTHELSTVADWDQANFQVCAMSPGLFTGHVLIGLTSLYGRLSLFDNKCTLRRFVHDQQAAELSKTGAVDDNTSDNNGTENRNTSEVHYPTYSCFHSTHSTTDSNTDSNADSTADIGKFSSLVLPYVITEEITIATQAEYVRILREVFRVHIPEEKVTHMSIPGIAWV